MADRSAYTGPFEPQSLYLQWLNRRQAWPMRLDRVMMRWLWGLVWVLLGWFAIILWSDGFAYGPRWYEVAGMVTIGAIILILPPVNTLLDFLVYVPRSVHDDVATTTMQAIFHAPVSTADIVTDLRRWAVAMNLRHLAPSAALLVGMFIIGCLKEPPDADSMIEIMLKGILPFAAVLFSVWWFLLGTGLASAAFPWRWTSAGVVLILWIMPVLVGVFWGGTVLAIRTWEEMFSPGMGYAVYEWQPLWYFGHYIALLIIPIRLAWVWAPRLMEMRRQGRWS